MELRQGQVVTLMTLEPNDGNVNDTMIDAIGKPHYIHRLNSDGSCEACIGERDTGDYWYYEKGCFKPNELEKIKAESRVF